MLTPGTSLSERFTLLRRLGEGGMGEVWLVRDHELDDEVVAKLLPEDASDDLLELLKRECKNARRLNHPGIVRVYDFHQAGGRSFVTMAHVPGRRLGDFRGRPAPEVLRLAVQVALALDHAHRQGVVHRDLSPSNVVVDAGGQVHLLDFGIAGVLGEARPSDDVNGLGALLAGLIDPMPEELRPLVASLRASEPAEHPASLATVAEELERLASTLDGKPKLRPPARRPKVVPPLEPPPPRIDVARGGGGWKWTVGVLFAVLAVAAVGVFAVLPRWVDVPRTPAPVVPPDQVEEAPGPPIVEAIEPPPPPPVDEAPAPAPPPPPPPVAPPPPKPDDGPFVRAMSEGLAALDRGDYAAARGAFTGALELRPEAAAARDGLAQAEEGERRERLATLRDAARRAEAEERWQDALARYREALGVDPSVSFALEGEPRSRFRAQLDDLLGFHLENPDRLSSSQVLSEAGELLGRAGDVADPGPRLKAQIAELAALLRRFATPVEVEILSDAQTEVTVYRVGRLGTFERRTLELRPGTYTVIGRRAGFRDVRRELVVVPGEAPEPIHVRCEEAI